MSYDREQIKKWSEMTGDDSEELISTIEKSAENRGEEVINNPKAGEQKLK